MIRNVCLNDAVSITDIYNEYITGSIVTFEENTISAEDMKSRIEKVTAADLPWLVAEHESEIKI